LLRLINISQKRLRSSLKKEEEREREREREVKERG
jgi:hypothetical protein